MAGSSRWAIQILRRVVRFLCVVLILMTVGAIIGAVIGRILGHSWSSAWQCAGWGAVVGFLSCFLFPRVQYEQSRYQTGLR